MPVQTKGGVRLEYRDLGLQRILTEFARAGVVSVRVGVVGAKANERTADGRLTNAENAVIQIEGLAPPHHTRRDFIGAPFRSNRAHVASILRRVAGNIIKGSTVEQAVDAAGYELVRISRDAIMSHDVPPPNKPATVEKKGFNHPLVDHLDLYDAISHRVVRDGGATLEAGSAIGDYDSYEIVGGG